MIALSVFMHQKSFFFFFFFCFDFEFDSSQPSWFTFKRGAENYDG